MSPTSRSERGFTLLEGMMAAAIAAVLGVAVLSVLSSTATLPREVGSRLAANEFARSVLEEYIVTYPALEPEGVLGSELAWRIEEETVPHLTTGRYEDLISLIEVTVTVDNLAAGRQLAKLSQVVVRGADP